MVLYSITYSLKNKPEKIYTVNVNAKDFKSAKRKIGKRHCYENGRMVNILEASILEF